MREWIIADSGGTKTDWCRVSEMGVQERLETTSYHPALLTAESRQSMKDFWMAHPHWLSLPLYFFGSGCFREEPRREMETFLQSLGFEHPKVRSDVHAAAWAALGSSPGWVAILGTGSVLVQWTGREVAQLIGGKGHLEGDEGSGYYFGRLLMEAVASKSLPEDLHSDLAEFHAKQTELSDAANEKTRFASLAAAFGEHPACQTLHAENIRLFLTRYSTSIPRGTSIHFVGSYADAQRTLLARLLPECGLLPGEIIARPIERLVEQSVYFID